MAYAERSSHVPVGTKAAIACLPLVAGGTIPFFGLTNLFWGSMYGFPGVWFHDADIWHPLWTDLIWILGWPAVVVWLSSRASDFIWSLGRSARISAVAAYLVSLLVLVPSTPLVEARPNGSFTFEHWPVFLRLLAW